MDTKKMFGQKHIFRPMKNFGPKRFLRLNKSLGTKLGWVQNKFWVQKDILG